MRKKVIKFKYQPDNLPIIVLINNPPPNLDFTIGDNFQAGHEKKKEKQPFSGLATLICCELNRTGKSHSVIKACFLVYFTFLE